MRHHPSESVADWAKAWLACGLFHLFLAVVVSWAYFTHILLGDHWSSPSKALLLLGGTLTYGIFLAGPAAVAVASARLLTKPSQRWMHVLILGSTLTALWGLAFLAMSAAEGEVSVVLAIVALSTVFVVATALWQTRIIGRGIA